MFAWVARGFRSDPSCQESVDIFKRTQGGHLKVTVSRHTPEGADRILDPNFIRLLDQILISSSRLWLTGAVQSIPNCTVPAFLNTRGRWWSFVTLHARVWDCLRSIRFTATPVRFLLAGAEPTEGRIKSRRISQRLRLIWQLWVPQPKQHQHILRRWG